MRTTEQMIEDVMEEFGFSREEAERIVNHQLDPALADEDEE
jgi:hypothetical protein